MKRRSTARRLIGAAAMAPSTETGRCAFWDYVLFDLTGASGLVSSALNPHPQWVGAVPAQAGRFRIAKDGKRVVLRFAPGTMLLMR